MICGSSAVFCCCFSFLCLLQAGRCLDALKEPYGVCWRITCALQIPLDINTHASLPNLVDLDATPVGMTAPATSTGDRLGLNLEASGLN